MSDENKIEWSNKHPMYNIPYYDNVRFRKDDIFCRVEKIPIIFGITYYRIVAYNREQKYSIVRHRATLDGALGLRDSIFNKPTHYGFHVE